MNNILDLYQGLFDVCARQESELTTLREQLNDLQEAAASARNLTRQLDVIWNGEEHAAKQASLCGMVSQLSVEVPQLRESKKQMLDEIRDKVNNLTEYKTFVRVEGDPVPTLPQIAKWCVIWILDEMEAKL